MLKCVRQSKVICSIKMLCIVLQLMVARVSVRYAFQLLDFYYLDHDWHCESQDNVTKPLGPGLFVRFGVGKRRLMLDTPVW